MQVPVKFYNEKDHDRYKALSIPQPQADGVFDVLRGSMFLPFSTRYRGDVLICSAAKPEVPGRISGVTVGLVEVVDCIPAGEDCWKWFFRNHRRVVEMPVKGGRGLFTLVVPKGDITPYPKHVILERKDYETKNT